MEIITAIVVFVGYVILFGLGIYGAIKEVHPDISVSVELVLYVEDRSISLSFV